MSRQPIEELAVGAPPAFAHRPLMSVELAVSAIAKAKTVLRF